MSKKWIDCSKLGRSKEKECAELLIESEGGKIRWATKEEDMFKHIDFYWVKDGKDIGIDVKSARKKNRCDLEPNYEINWVELKNVHGRKGWLDGEMDYIVFEHKEFWFFVKPDRIKELLKEKMSDKNEICDSKEIYKFYRRKGRLDLLVMVPNDDLVKIASKILKKKENE